jgi:hypothetical protein
MINQVVPSPTSNKSSISPDSSSCDILLAEFGERISHKEWKRKRHDEFIGQKRRENEEFRSPEGAERETTINGKTTKETIKIIPALPQPIKPQHNHRLSRRCNTQTKRNFIGMDTTSNSYSTLIIDWYMKHPQGHPYLEIRRGSIAGQDEYGVLITKNIPFTKKELAGAYVGELLELEKGEEIPPGEYLAACSNQSHKTHRC